QPANYQWAPANDGGQLQPALPPAGPAGGSPGWKNGRGSGVFGLVMAGGFLAVLCLFLVVPFLLERTGITGFAVGFVASLVPLGTVLLTVRFIDRWEPEPKPLLLFAFAWGAVVSIAVTMLIQPYFSLVAGPASGLDYTTFAVTVQAPVVEEFAKSLGLLLLVLFAPKHFNGPVDGVVFAFTIAAGFAFTENILYFGRAIAESSDPGTDLAVVFFLRGVLSPFAHAIFTGTTGLVMGFAAGRGNTGLSRAWNSMGRDFLGRYVMVQVPIFLLAVLVIVLLRVAERRLTRQRLTEYAAAGWFTAAEVDMLATAAGRRSALRWARSTGRGVQMKALLDAATQLALTRQRILSGRDVPAHQRDEQHQLAGIAALRAAVVG
ncbi:PrsW family intramembrane metalloprotease, partial [Microbacterium sp. Bi128]|uniref:PrsW family intramembrane metalloprotease n=1 Tax=Microbacterium sp. Bi128 TaxID=2821115 RepID=UPI0035AC0FE4